MNSSCPGAKGNVDSEEKIKRAMTAEPEELWKLIREHNPEIIMNATLNRNLTEEMAVFMAKKKSSPSEALGFLAGDVRFRESYKLKIALCKNPKTPQRITFSLLKFLRIFDLSDLTRDQTIPLNVRQKIEQTLSEKIPSMASGVKTALARRANSSTVILLLEQGDEHVISACLDSPALTEGLLYRIINKTNTKPLLIRMIAEHPKWSLRYPIRFALLRNFSTSLVCATGFISHMKTTDLRDLYADPKLPASTRPFIFNELLRRNESTEATNEEIYTLSEEEDSGT